MEVYPQDAAQSLLAFSANTRLNDLILFINISFLPKMNFLIYSSYPSPQQQDTTVQLEMNPVL